MWLLELVMQKSNKKLMSFQTQKDGYKRMNKNLRDFQVCKFYALSAVKNRRGDHENCLRGLQEARAIQSHHHHWGAYALGACCISLSASSQIGKH